MKNEITAIFIIAAALLTGISYYTNAAGIFGEYLKKISIGSFGWLMYTIPIIMFAYGINLFMQKKANDGKDYNCALIIVIFLLSTTLFHIFSYELLGDMDIKESWNMFYGSDIALGGGFIGWLIAEPFINMFGIWGTGIIVVTGILVVIMVITKISLVSIFNFIKSTVLSVYYKVSAFIKNIFFEEEQDNEDENKASITINTDDIFDENRAEGAEDFNIEIFDEQDNKHIVNKKTEKLLPMIRKQMIT